MGAQSARLDAMLRGLGAQLLDVGSKARCQGRIRSSEGCKALTEWQSRPGRCAPVRGLRSACASCLDNRCNAADPLVCADRGGCDASVMPARCSSCTTICRAGADRSIASHLAPPICPMCRCRSQSSSRLVSL